VKKMRDHEPQYNIQPVGLRDYFDDSISRRLWMRAKGTMDGYDAFVDKCVDEFLKKFSER
jgi:hypothetical protein